VELPSAPFRDGLALSPSGRLLAVVTRTDDETGLLRLHAVAEGRSRWEVRFPLRARTSLRVDVLEQAGMVVASVVGEDAVVLAWRISDGALLLDRPGNGAARTIAAGVGGRVAVAASWGGFELVDTGPASRALPADRHAGQVRSLAVSADGRWLASAGEDHRVVIRDLEQVRVVRVLDVREGGAQVVMGPRAGLLSVVSRDRAHIHELASGAEVAAVRPTAGAPGTRPRGARLLAGGAQVGFILDDNQMEVRALDGDRLVELRKRWCDVGLWANQLDDTGSGHCAFLAGSTEAGISLTVRDLAGALVWGPRRVSLRDQAAFVVSPAARLAALGDYGGRLTVVPLGKGAAFELPHAHSAFVRSLAFSADGRRLYSAGGDGALRVWDLDARAVVDTIRFDDRLDFPSALALGADEALFVGTARGWCSGSSARGPLAERAYFTVSRRCSLGATSTQMSL
jgi:hypothetical protein